MTLYKYICILCMCYTFFCCDHKKVQTRESNNITLDSLQNVCRNSLFTSKGFEESYLLKKEAESHDNDLYIGFAYKYMMLTAMNTLQEDSIYIFAEKAKYHFGKTDEEDQSFNVDIALIEWEMQYKSKQTALDKATELLEKIDDNKLNELYTYELISNIYNIMGRMEEAESAFNKMMQIKCEYDIQLKGQLPYIFLRGAQMTTDLQKYEQSLAYCDSAQTYIKEYYNSDTNQALLILLNLNKANNFIGLERLDEAKAALDSLDVIIEGDKSNGYYYYIEGIWAKYYYITKNYQKALDRIEPTITYFRETSNIPNYVKSQDQKILILTSIQNFKDAYELKAEISTYSDSLAIVDAHQQLNELQTIYQTDRLRSKAEQDALKLKNTHNIIISLVITCLLLLITAIIVIRYSAILKRKNKKLFLQYKEHDKQKEGLKNIIIYNEKERSHLALFDKIELYLNESQAYLDPSISREFVAAQIGTNRQYLTEAIQAGKNMTFMEYINDFRLNYSCHLLSQKTDLSIEDIYINAGYNNKTTFYRLFKQKYDLTPKEFRKIALNYNPSSPK